MQPTTSDPGAPRSRTILSPLGHARPTRVGAVLWVAEQLHDHFPTLPVVAFGAGLHAFQPDLWEDCNDLWLDSM
jgi:hypothetical protein